MRPRTAGILIGLMLFAGATYGARADGPDNDQRRCVKLLPKGGGTVVHGTFVPLNPGEYLKLCTRVES